MDDADGIRVDLEYVAFSSEIDQFDAGCVSVYEKALDDAKHRGISVKALLLCNPHNPLGRSIPWSWTTKPRLTSLLADAIHETH
jgi:bifunctional pyridoxal-dependent enzyme with beta-cystathionase and maltose regulon repressor activities